MQQVLWLVLQPRSRSRALETAPAAGERRRISSAPGVWFLPGKARLRRDVRYKALMDIWLYLHVPLTFALLAALTAHIISIFYMM